MATNQAMRQGIYEGILYIGLKAGEAMAACDVVMLDTADGYVKKCTSTGVPFGFVAEAVTDAGIPDYYPGGLVSHTAKTGDQVGVYICGGVLNHYAPTAATFGAELFAGTSTAGKCATASATSNKKVGICVVAENSDHICKIKSYL
jgi:hypothetical protein